MADNLYLDDGDLGGNPDARTYGDWLAVGLVYPPGGWNPEVEVLTVASGERKTVQIELGASCLSIMHPICVPHVSPYHAPGISCYTVTGSDGLPIKRLEWQQRGGYINVEVNEDTTTATLTIQGAGIPELSPFSIGVSDGSNDYSTLRLLGTGLAFRKQKLLVETGVPKDLAAQDSIVIDNEFVSTRGAAYEAAVKAMSKALGGYQTIQVNSSGINRLGDTGSYIRPKIGWYNDLLTDSAPDVTTVADWNAHHADLDGSSTIGEFNDWGFAQAAGRFENQAFGNVAGARVPFDNNWYRVRSATIGPEGISYTAELDMVLSDLATGWDGVTVGQFNASWPAGATLEDFNLQALPEGSIQ